MIQPPIWGNLRTPWEIAYIKSYLESNSPHEVTLIDLGPETLPLVKQFGEDIRRLVDDTFETETFLNSLGFISSVAEAHLIRLFYPYGSPAFHLAMYALLAGNTTHRGDALDAITENFIVNPFFASIARRFRGLSKSLANSGYDYVGCATHITSFPMALSLLKCVKQVNPHIRTILSGYQATMVANETLQACPWVDFVVRGESEKGYEWILSNKFVERQVVDLTACPVDINRMPAPDYRGLDMSNYKMISLMASRNCPHGKCAFCQENTYWSSFRFRRPELLFEDMEVQYHRHGFTRFDFVDLDMQDFVVGLSRILTQEGMPLNWSGAMRADKRAPDILRELTCNCCKSLFFGFESGSPRLLKLMRKNITLATLQDTMRAAKEMGIRVKLTCITGLPTETNEEFQSTLRFVEDHIDLIDIVLVQCFKALKHSPIAMALETSSNPYGLRPVRIDVLEPIQDFLFAVHYTGMPGPDVALQRFVIARRTFHNMGVYERATLLLNHRHRHSYLLGIR
jgi:radical SAM superfamily enzyme YgiQ (UPF0313 family)